MTATTTKPAAKKSAKATKATHETNGRAHKEGLRKPQVRILAALRKATKPLTRNEISEKAPADLAMLNSYIGSHDDAIRAKNDKGVCLSLLTAKFVTYEEPEEGRGSAYAITKLGRKALEAHEKAEKAK